MSDELAIFAVLGFIYLTDCFLWISDHSAAFVTWTGRRWKDKTAGEAFRISDKGALFLNPFPPLGAVVCCPLPPLSMSPDGICSFNCEAPVPAAGSEREVVAIHFEEITDIRRDDRDILINGARFCRCADALPAEELCALLKSLRNAELPEREALIRRFRESRFDEDTARARLEDATRRTAFLRGLCNFLFVYLFILAPALVLYSNMPAMLIPPALGLIPIVIAASIMFHRLHKRFYPGAGEDGVSALIRLILYPPAFIRACDLLTEKLLRDSHPLVAGRLLLEPVRFREYAARALRRLRYPLATGVTEKRALEILSRQNRIHLDTAMAYLRDTANIGEEPFEPPIPEDPDSTAYCPRCLSEFTRTAGECPDCPGIALKPFGIRSSNLDESE